MMMIIASKSKVEIKEVQLKSKFEIKNHRDKEYSRYGDCEGQSEGNSLLISKQIFVEGADQVWDLQVYEASYYTISPYLKLSSQLSPTRNESLWLEFKC